ncbi:MAG: hypothetical protein FJW39_23015 [Acidobacteria bacterium]|nr:hypothetical protein [Acidobacteriota bacterium]
MSYWRLLSLAAVGTIAHAQSEADLKRFFEGKRVTVKVEMPGTHQGLDVYPLEGPRMDMSHYSSRVKNFGVSLRTGDSVMVTLVHVTKKNIEFQLGGGGYGTYVSKSDYERRLERDLNRASSEDERRRIRSDLDRERSRRQREERANRALNDSLRVERERLILEKRREGGSRFNLWYPEGRLAESVPTPQDVMTALGEWVDFSALNPRTTRTVSKSQPAAATPVKGLQQRQGGSVHRGMSRAEVHSMLGRTTSSRQVRQGDLNTVIERFDQGDEVTEVTYVNDVVVKFTTASK